jgi:uncharacterized protein YecT (DUF1311 family)
MRLSLALGFVLVAGSASAEDLIYSNDATEICLSSGGGETCIGIAADNCMEATPGGWSTYGMSGCLHKEWEYWDAKLNAAYKVAMASAKQLDSEHSGHIKRAEALRAAQRAWISFRDKTCEFEYSQWGGGTGGGPASVQCQMVMTGKQTLYLQSVSGG